MREEGTEDRTDEERDGGTDRQMEVWWQGCWNEGREAGRYEGAERRKQAGR